jgi:hypothetical protein
MPDLSRKVMFPFLVTKARPVPNGGKRSFDVNCYRWVIIHDNSNKMFLDSYDDQEKPKRKGFSQNSRTPSLKSEIVFPPLSDLKI